MELRDDTGQLAVVKITGTDRCRWIEPTPPEPTPLSSLLTAAKLRRLASMMDELNRRRGYEYGLGPLDETEVQDDLRKWADGLEAGTIA